MGKQLSLPVLPPVARGISWADLFGRNIREVTPETRRSRWEEAKRIATSQERLGMTDEWEDCEHRNCRHFASGWCELQGLPAGFNPITQIPGMACMGSGFQVKAGA